MEMKGGPRTSEGRTPGHAQASTSRNTSIASVPPASRRTIARRPSSSPIMLRMRRRSRNVARSIASDGLSKTARLAKSSRCLSLNLSPVLSTACQLARESARRVPLRPSPTCAGAPPDSPRPTCNQAARGPAPRVIYSVAQPEHRGPGRRPTVHGLVARQGNLCVAKMCAPREKDQGLVAALVTPGVHATVEANASRSARIRAITACGVLAGSAS